MVLSKAILGGVVVPRLSTMILPLLIVISKSSHAFAKQTHQSLKIVFGVCDNSSVISEQHVTDCNLPHFAFCIEACSLEEIYHQILYDDPNAYLSSIEKKILNRVGGGAQLLMVNCGP